MVETYSDLEVIFFLFKNMSSADANSLKAGVTKSNANAIKSQQTKKVVNSQMTGGPTKMGGAGQAKQKNNKSRMKTSTSERDTEIVKFNDQIVTPKKLITEKFKEQAQTYMSAIQDAQEKKKNQKSSMIGKGSSSIVDSSVRSR